MIHKSSPSNRRESTTSILKMTTKKNNGGKMSPAAQNLYAEPYANEDIKVVEKP